MKKFITSLSCDSKSGLHGVREKLRAPTSYVSVGYAHSEYAVLLNALNSWKKGKDLWFWKTYPKPLKFLEVKPKECEKLDEVAYRLKNIPFTHFYYIDNNKLYLTDGYAQQVIVVIPFTTDIYSVAVDIDTLDPKFLSNEIHNALVSNIENIISMYNDYNGLTSPDIEDNGSDRMRIPNEVIDYNKFNYDNGMVRGDSHKFKEKDNFLHIDLVSN
tara:strand:- start:2334 stop:2978 length:645 start_codon:yes stop_codon:yes gene_type:complete